jgi:DNA repair protein RadA/Sms
LPFSQILERHILGKEKIMFVCNNCGEETPKWQRFCPVCAAEMALEKNALLSIVDKTEKKAGPDLVHLPSGFPMFDQTFGGGFLQSFTYFIHAERGTGKTTFLLQVLAFLVMLGKSVVFFSFEESEDGIRKKCRKYGIDYRQQCFVYENIPGIIERTIQKNKPDCVLLDSLKSLAKYNSGEVVSTLYRFRLLGQKERFALIVIGEERKDNSDYLGSASISHIIDVQVKMVQGLDEEVIVSTPDKNRDTDDKTSRCFFRRTPKGLVEILESETGYLPRHNEKTALGLAAFVARDGNEFSVDEITAAMDMNAKKASLAIVGVNNAKAKSLLTVLMNCFLISEANFVLRANRTEKNLGDAELACLIAVLSLLFDKPIPVDTVFIAGVDNRGYLLPLEGMERRVRRAEALGYKRIIGPKANGIQTVSWQEAETVEGVWKALGFME